MAFEKESSRTHFLLSKFQNKITTLRMEMLNRGDLIFGPQAFTQHSRLFHYTTAAGLQGIIEKKAIWLTSTLYMNDLSEQSHSLDIARKTALSLAKSSKYSEKFKRLLASAISEHQNTYATYSKPSYIACFSINGDSLPMWNMYSDSSGISIEFDLQTNYNFTFGPNCFFRDLIYDDRLLSIIVEKIIDEYYCEYKKDEDLDDTPYLMRVNDVYSSEILNNIFHCSIHFKHMAFSNEHETRLMYTPNGNNDIKFRVKNDFLIPYFEMPLLELDKRKKLPIVSITIGPSIEQKLISSGISHFMKVNGYDDVEIKNSQVPYVPR